SPEAVFSEVELGAELPHTPRQDADRIPPLRTVPVVQGEDVARVRRIVDVDISLQTASSEPEDLAHAEVKLAATRLEERVGFDEADEGGRVARPCRVGTRWLSVMAP